MREQIQHGDTVRCTAPSIDHKIGCNEIGVVTGFARFSAYHGREAYVELQDGKRGWFWLRDLEAAQ